MLEERLKKMLADSSSKKFKDGVDTYMSSLSLRICLPGNLFKELSRFFKGANGSEMPDYHLCL